MTHLPTQVTEGSRTFLARMRERQRLKEELMTSVRQVEVGAPAVAEDRVGP